MQVLRYTLGQFYDAHRDYWDPEEFPDKHRFIHPNSKTWYNRHATLLWYLQRPEEGSGWYRNLILTYIVTLSHLGITQK
jgi:hypothetical protein